MMLHKHIDGATPLDDYSDLKLKWIVTREQLDAAEADNILGAIEKFLGRKRYSFPDWYTIKHIDQVHQMMFGKVWKWAGKYRKTEKSIGVPAYQIPFELKKLQNDLEDWSQRNWDPIEISARAHHRLVWIHPYENGNGRHGRLLGDMILHSHHFAFPIWPNIVNQGKVRKEYLKALREADHGNFADLKKYIIECGAVGGASSK